MVKKLVAHRSNSKCKKYWQIRFRLETGARTPAPSSRTRHTFAVDVTMVRRHLSTYTGPGPGVPATCAETPQVSYNLLEKLQPGSEWGRSKSMSISSTRRLSSSSSSSTSIHSFSLPPSCFPRNYGPPDSSSTIPFDPTARSSASPRPSPLAVRRRPPTISHVLFPLPLPYCPHGSLLHLFQILAAALCEKKSLLFLA